ncbi:UDP-N-acetylglucosamine 1-carboxyvinyltransferase, partial [Aliarcobacter butzleri]
GNLPNVVDINTYLKLILKLGGSVVKEENRVKINTSTINNPTATYDIVKTMRASTLVFGPLLARFGHCRVSLPGGCA